MKRILHCTLIFMVLVTSGCGFFSNESSSIPKTSSSPSPPPQDKINFAAAATDVQKALDRLNAPGKAGSSATVKFVKDAIDDAIEKLGTNEKQLREFCKECGDNITNEAVEVLQALIPISTTLGKEPQKKITDLEGDVRENLQEVLPAASIKLKDLGIAKAKTGETSSVVSSAPKSETKDNEDGDPWWWSALISSAKIIAVIGGLVLLAIAMNYLWKRSWKTVELNVGRVLTAHIAASREAQPDYAPKLSSLSSAQAEMSSRLTELDTEVRSLARLVRESLAVRRSDHNSSYGGLNQSPVEAVAPKDEPEFPVSAGDYLGKMNRFANVVRPDFQNGILVNDPAGEGELVLIRDSRDDAQPLFVVPRATQFQTKQDFYTYYQKYYDCPRPSAGDVWIIGPAVVEKVAGGWQLREKGMLEVR